MKYASIGSISHGTLRPEDLLEAFWHELEYQLGRQDDPADRDNMNKLREYTLGKIQDDLWGDDGNVVDDAQAISEAITELEDALEHFAPPYCRFGAHEGDGSDFGYWPDHDDIDDLQTYESSDKHWDTAIACLDEADLQDEFKVVNDHGNVTIYRVKLTYEVVAEFV